MSRFRRAMRSERNGVACSLAAAIAVIGGFAAGCGSAPAPSSDNARRTQVVFSNLNAAILSISGTPDGEIIAVGADPKDGLGPYVLRYDGDSWRRLRSGAVGDLWWISVEMIDGSFYMAGTAGKILRYDPQSNEFQQFTLAGGSSMFGVWGTSAQDIWAVGGDLEAEFGGVIWHFDGNEWKLLEDGLPMLYKVWGRASDDAFAVGRLGTVLHFDGLNWTSMGSDTDEPLFTVHGNDSQLVASGGVGGAVLEELSHGTLVNRAAAGTVQMNGVFIGLDGQAVAVGRKASMVFRTPAGWEVQPLGIESQVDFHSVWVDREGGIWTVGGNLTSELNDGIVVYIGTKTVGRSAVVE